MRPCFDSGWGLISAGGFDDTVKREQCTVILKHMFTQQEVLVLDRLSASCIACLLGESVEKCRRKAVLCVL